METMCACDTWERGSSPRHEPQGDQVDVTGSITGREIALIALYATFALALMATAARRLGH